MLRSRKSMMVMVVVPDISNPFFSEVLRGIDEGLSSSGYGIIIANLGRTENNDSHYGGLIASGQVDGVILLCGRMLRSRDQARDIPVVAGCEIIPRVSIPQVDVANRDAARAATAHLLDLGHRRLAYISGPPRNILDRERKAGFLAALQQAKLPANRAIFFTGDFTFHSGAIAADELLRMPPAKRPTAVFAANDEMAIGLIKRLGEHGLVVPRDISVVGFDAIDFTDFCEPALTTVRQPRSEIGATAARLLIEAMNGESPARPAQIRLPAELVIRGTTAPPASKG
jgi:LacI family repressor for deo operon, udp, cdd, tsx, nupC, and nupG